jgi:glycosyltransferase involved in cell wall biosynthesis
MSIAVCIPTMRRFDFLRESIPKYLENPHVNELIITDETGEDYLAITAAFSHPKLRVYQNERRLGSVENKQRAASYATSDYIAILDSDNFADLEYFQAFRNYLQHNTTTPRDVYLPCHAMPNFNYEAFIGKTINRFTLRSHWPAVNTCMNTMNMIIPREFLATFHIMNDKPLCDQASGAWDAMYFSFYAIFDMNANMVVVPGMKYHHRVHGGSWYIHTVDQSKHVYSALMDRYFSDTRMSLLEWQGVPKNSSGYIIQASSTNEDDAWMPFPIGFHYRYTRPFRTAAHVNTVFCGITDHTDSTRRPTGKNRRSILETLSRNGIANRMVSTSEYYDTLPTYKFVVSPEGNGIDCHRHYEALMAGCIPIIERNPLTEEKYKGCPVMYTDDYSEITPAYLDAKYEEMKTAVYDFSRLFMNDYSADQQSEIKRCGNFWMTRLTGQPVYDVPQPALPTAPESRASGLVNQGGRLHLILK